MKKPDLIITILLLLLFFSCGREVRSNPEVIDQIKTHIDNEEWFRLKSFYFKNSDQLSLKDSLLYGAFVDILFRSNTSIEELKWIESQYTRTLSQEEEFLIQKMKRSIYKRDFERRKARETDELILSKYDQIADSSFKEDLRKEIETLNSIQDFPSTICHINNDIHIPLDFGEYEKLYAEVKIGNRSYKFIIDSGCWNNIISSAVAEDCVLEVFDARVNSMAINGDSLKHKSTFIDEMQIGDLRIENIIFDVLDYRILGVPEYDFYIDGIIGLDLLQRLKEVRIINRSEMIIPQHPKQYNIGNFTFSKGIPLYCALTQENAYGDSLRMKLDIGAYATMLSKTFYIQHEEEIKETCTSETIEYGSLGGRNFFQQYIMDSLTFSVSDTCVSIYELGIHTNITHKGYTRMYHGMLGMDFISQFKEIIVSFEYNTIIFQ